MEQKTGRRLLSILLTLALVLGLMPVMSLTALAAAGTASDPISISLWSDLKNELAKTAPSGEGPTNPTYYKLSQGITAGGSDSAITVAQGRYVVLDLNGEKIDRHLSAEAENGWVFNVLGNLTIKDSGSGGKITGGYSNYFHGGGVYVNQGGTFTMEGGTISKNRASDGNGHGGGVYVEAGCTFTMKSGTISENTAIYGGGVCVEAGGKFTMDLEVDGAGQESAEGIDEDVIAAENDANLDLATGDLVSEAPEVPATVAYRFIVNGEEYAAQAAVEGEEIVRPADPEAAEGMAFAGWILEDGAALFTDADGDGEIDPVIAHVDPQRPEVIVTAKFVEKEQPVDDDGGVDAAAAGETEPSDEQKPSPSGEGGSAAALTDEVVPQGEPSPADDTEGDATSSVSPSGETAERSARPSAAPEGEASGERDDGNADAAATEDEGTPAADQPTADQPAETLPVPNELTYTGEAQALVSAESAWLYSLDGENYSTDLPAAVDAGEYTVFFKAAEDAEAQSLTVTVAKADVVFIPPTVATGEE